MSNAAEEYLLAAYREYNEALQRYLETVDIDCPREWVRHPVAEALGEAERQMRAAYAAYEALPR